MALTGTLFLFRVQGTRTSTTQQHNRCTLPRALRACTLPRVLQACTLPRAPQTRTPPQARSGRMRRQPCVTRYGDRQTMHGRANKDQSALFFLVSGFTFFFLLHVQSVKFGLITAVAHLGSIGHDRAPCWVDRFDLFPLPHALHRAFARRPQSA